ncbi:hypothetical protein ccbrp13_10270 [Ktedonobacteria bacterium brp13]|jgi:hypothetical protein|nr:hypothetical protein ccbrp13_10270 [Ktedonobacteria bacterium brp13]
MTYSRSNRVEEQQEANLKAKNITAVCEQLHITLDPIDWQQSGMWALVKIHDVEIAYLLDFKQLNADDVLRRVQIKMLEHTALETTHARPGLKALIWSPIDVIQPQTFLSLWNITLETGERIPIVESIKDEKRVYELYQFDQHNESQLASLFGPACQGEYHLGEKITTKEREHQYTGEIIYVIPAGKVPTSRKPISRGYHTIAGTAYTNEAAPKYIVDCNDGFPHIVHQSQVIRETPVE